MNITSFVPPILPTPYTGFKGASPKDRHDSHREAPALPAGVLLRSAGGHRGIEGVLNQSFSPLLGDQICVLDCARGKIGIDKN